jgi:hypothetical protein
VAAHATSAQNRLHAFVEKRTLPRRQARERQQPKSDYRLAPLPN